MFASKVMMDNKVHISDGTTGGMSSAKSNKNHLFGHAIAEDLVRRYFSRSLDKKDKVGLPAFGMQALCLPPERRVFKLCYLCELMAVIAGLVMFFSAYLLRFDATSTFGIIGAFLANCHARGLGLLLLDVILIHGHSRRANLFLVSVESADDVFPQAGRVVVREVHRHVRRNLKRTRGRLQSHVDSTEKGSVPRWTPHGPGSCG